MPPAPAIRANPAILQWAREESGYSPGRVAARLQAKEEVHKVGSQGLGQWADGHERLFVKTGDVLVPAQAIQGQSPGLLDPKAEFEEADAYVIALAQLREGIVVT